MPDSFPIPPRRSGPRAAVLVCPLLCLALCLALWPTKACAGGELTFGMSAAFSGPARGLGMEYHRGLMAAFDEVNARGGAGGWRLGLSLRDDAYSPAEALSNTLEFVERGKVFALLGYVGTPTTARVLPLLQHFDSYPLLLLFPLTGADLLRDPSYLTTVFRLRASYLDEARPLVEALLATGSSRIAVFHQADVYGRNGWDGVRRTLRTHGLSIASEATYRRGAAFSQNFSREVRIILDGQPDSVVTVGTAPACAAFIRDLRAAGFQGLVATLSFADADNMVKLLADLNRATGVDCLKGLVFSQVVPSYEDESLPAVRRYRQAMARVRPPTPPQLSPEQYAPNALSFVSFEGYLAGMALAEAVARMGPKASPERLRETFAGLSAVDLGLGAKVDLRPGPGQGLRRTYLTIYQGGRFHGVAKLDGLHP